MADLRPVYVAGDGDVKGPASSSNNFLPLFADVTGKQLKSSGTGVTTQGLAILDDNTSAEQRNTIGLNQVNNTSDINKPVSTSQQNALNLKANKGANSDITSITGLTTALAVNQGGTGAFEPDQARSNLLVTGRNRVINGSMRIISRGNRTFANSQIGYAGPDRWLALNQAAGGQFTQSASSITEKGITVPAIRQTVNSAMTDAGGSKHWAGFVQRIEGFNSYDLVNKVLSVSFLFLTNVTGKFSVRVLDSNSTHSFIHPFAAVANVPIRISFTMPANPNLVIPRTNVMGMFVGVGMYNAGTAVAPTPDVWLNGAYGTMGGVFWPGVVGNFISMAEFQLEVGTPTPFERIDVAQESAQCLRYFENVSITVNTNNMNWVWWRYSVNKRATCTLALISGDMRGVNVSPQDSTGFRTSGQASSDSDAYWACDSEL